MKTLKNDTQRRIHFPCHIAEIRVSYSHKVKESDRPRITSAQDAVDVLRAKWKKNRIQYVEECKVILLNRANGVLGVRAISQGGQSGCIVDPKIIFAIALKANASSLILTHNHPSGNLKPSEADIRLTHKMKEAGKFLDLPMLDHIILTSESYLSFQDEGLL